MIRSWRAEATRFKTTPAKARAGSSARQPSTSAATVRVDLLASTTSRSGARKSFASSAVECVPVGVLAVEEPAIALDDRQVGARAGQRGQDRLLRHEEGVEGSRAALRRGAQPGRVEVVGALLERRDGEAAAAQRADEAGRHQGLAGIASQAGDHDAGQGE